jgi:acetyl-CoA carboxylase/biotin carboxylase 1
MEMYADEDARGGVLEPEGIVNLKYRRDRQLETMARLDAPYAELKAQLAEKPLSPERQSEIKLKMTERESLLLPVYSQISLQFADLHDRAGRMQAKNTIRHPLVWKNARRFFYWRLRRRLNEESLIKKMANTSTKDLRDSRANSLRSLKAWTGIQDFEHDDRAVATWYEENRKSVTAKLDGLKSEGVSFDIAALLSANKEGGMKGLKQYLDTMPVQEREEAFKYLKG